VNALIVINDAPYGSERPYNARRIAVALSSREDVEIRVCLIPTPWGAWSPASSCRTATTT
jgi:sulfur relay (sulfurtransferase) complex TusBCD TusD component (DsrE family)